MATMATKEEGMTANGLGLTTPEPQKSAFPQFPVGFLFLLLLGFGLIVVFTLATKRPGVALPVAGFVALAALLSGALLGFLFGIPRTNTSEATAITPGRFAMVRPNTNLEQISDWLTKILVGVTLTQLPEIGAAAGRLINFLGPALGGATYSTAFAGAILVYFSVFGFLAGWLLTFLRLPKAIARISGPGKPEEKASEATNLLQAGRTQEAKEKFQEVVAAL